MRSTYIRVNTVDGLRLDIECLCGNGFFKSVFHSHLAVI